MVVPIFGTSGMFEDNVLFASIVTVATPCQGFRAQYVSISSCFVDTLLLIVLHGHMCKFLCVGEEFIFMRTMFWIPEYILVFLDLIGIYSKTYFILRNARYETKSDYLN